MGNGIIKNTQQKMPPNFKSNCCGGGLIIKYTYNSWQKLKKFYEHLALFSLNNMPSP